MRTSCRNLLLVAMTLCSFHSPLWIHAQNLEDDPTGALESISDDFTMEETGESTTPAATTTDTASTASVISPAPEAAAQSMARPSSSGTASAALASVVQNLDNGAAITSGIGQCYVSLKGQSIDIDNAYTALAPGMSSSTAIDGATGFGATLFQAYFRLNDNTNQNPLYELFRIYLDAQAHSGDPVDRLSDVQQTAYSKITPACSTSFSQILMTYLSNNDEVVDSLSGGNGQEACTNYFEETSNVNVTFCLEPAAIWANDEGIYANLNAAFINYGQQICNVSFYIIDVEDATSKTPAWLPNADTAYPDGLPGGDEENVISLTATVPWNWTYATNKNLPIFEINEGFYACPLSTPAPTTSRTPRSTKGNPVYTHAADCFHTEECANLVSYYLYDKCNTYAQMLTTGCSTCTSHAMDTTAAACAQMCDPEQCGHAADKKKKGGKSAVTTTSGAAASVDGKFSTMVMMALVIVGSTAAFFLF